MTILLIIDLDNFFVVESWWLITVHKQITIFVKKKEQVFFNICSEVGSFFWQFSLIAILYKLILLQWNLYAETKTIFEIYIFL